MAFMSYSRLDDQNDFGLITRLYDRLSRAVQAQIGKPFEIFIDHNDIKTGEDWQRRIVESLNAATFFIPVVSPSFLQSEQCRNELKCFLKREARLERKDLIFPIYYLGKHLFEGPFQDDPDLPRETNHTICELRGELASHQWLDWRTLRFEPMEGPAVRRALAKLAEHIESALRRTSNAAKSRSQGESAAQPRRMAEGHEQLPLASFLLSPADSAEPRLLLEMAMLKRKNGQYQAAKDLHVQMMRMGIDWTQDIALFIDQLYFSIGLHDKLEEWTELDSLERLVFQGAFSRIKPLITPSAYKTVRTMYQSSMALSMLRQMRLGEAQARIEEVLTDPTEPLPPSESPPAEATAAANILYANALITRALVVHAKWSLEERDGAALASARADLEAAGRIYGQFARMGTEDEFHHLGRFYGTRAFLRIAEWQDSSGGGSLAMRALLDDARHAHRGKNRTAYGRVAGQYCEAYCRIYLSELAEQASRKSEHLAAALALLASAGAALAPCARLARVKITGLAAHAASRLDDQSGCDVSALASAHQKAIDELRPGDRALLGRYPLQAWLATPIN